jgi:uncharacterized protein YndB with AHSA1/START domain
MHTSSTPSPLSERELVITRISRVSPEKLFAGWTDAEAYPKWFCPRPWYVSDVQLDVRPGGYNSMTICGPNGERFPNRGVYLEVIPNEKLVFTDCFLADWEPNPDFMFVGILTFERLPDGGTRYTARARHWTKEATEKHAAMGFHDGWNIAFDQLEELMS